MREQGWRDGRRGRAERRSKRGWRKGEGEGRGGRKRRWILRKLKVSAAQFTRDKVASDPNLIKMSTYKTQLQQDRTKGYQQDKAIP
jgi:hypothetical protein